MMKHTQKIFAKYCGRAFSTLASSTMCSSVKHAWKEQKSFGLFVALAVGYYGHLGENLYKRREHYYKVKRMSEEQLKRGRELVDRGYGYQRELLEHLELLLEDRKTSS